MISGMRGPAQRAFAPLVDVGTLSVAIEFSTTSGSSIGPISPCWMHLQLRS